MLKKIKTSFTDTMGINYPIIAAPMFLVSNTDIVVEASEAGGIGTFPALNYRPIEQYAEALKNIKSRTKKPIGVNVIVNKSNTRQREDIKVALDHGVEMFITSLGSPKSVIQDAHKNGAKVFCDVTNLEHALKVQDMGADGVIAVGAGAGGHAGPISPLVLIPWLKTRLQIPIIAAGGIAHGSMISACLALGASGVSVGTRFIASREAQVDQSYKDAIVNSTPEDIVMTTRVSGTPAAVINTPYVQKMGTDLPWAMKILKDYKLTKKYMVPLIHLMGMKSLEAAATKPTWKTVWTAGQSVGLVEEILTVKEIYAKLINEYDESVKSLSQLGLD
ncbi:NAD(P)H-dependent flavin oxidoreductase [Bdellovibrio bacteriovorus]|uniref:NAD(P)H-dependent flavin oxidoreductase n=1 Tax=Bdellovibrio bacteriovorus TaxID=959 RepID=UPI003AA958E6